jgi:hypothetical protein
MIKKLLSGVLAFGLAYAGSGNFFFGIPVVPQAKYKFDDGSEIKTKTMLGVDMGIIYKFDNNIIVGVNMETVLGKTKDDYSVWTGSVTPMLDVGYRFDTAIPVDVYGIVGYRWAHIDENDANGFGYGAGIAANISWFRPTIEYTHFNMSVNGYDYDDDRVTFQLNYLQW